MSFGSLNESVKELKIDNLVQLNYISGVIDNKQLKFLQKTVFRVARGNILALYVPLDEKQSEESLQNFNLGKTGFLFTFSGPKDGPLCSKLNILVSECGARQYPLPRDSNDLIGRLIKAQQENSEAERVLLSSKKKLAEYSREWSTVEEMTGTTKFNRIKGKLLFVAEVLDMMTRFRNSEHFLIGKFWLPESGTSYIEEALFLLNQRKDLAGFKVVPEPQSKHAKPPTRFHKNELLHQYQKIVDTYGVPRYKEINPAVISSVSFPFLFGLMFGDIAHGFILFLFGLFTFLRGRKLADWMRIEHLEMRSLGILLLMMGFFAVYAGLVYNDFLALPVTIVQSCYRVQDSNYGTFPNFRTPIPRLSMAIQLRLGLP